MFALSFAVAAAHSWTGGHGVLVIMLHIRDLEVASVRASTVRFVFLLSAGTHMELLGDWKGIRKRGWAGVRGENV